VPCTPSPDDPFGRTPDVERALVRLCAQVLPVWARQLANSRSQSETAVAEMLTAFAEIGPHLDMTARQSKQITAALTEGQDGITQLARACDRELEPVLQQITGPAADAVRRVITMVHKAVDALEEISKPFEYETQMVNLQVDRMYQGFQYQDRISQMMTLLHNDIERLCFVLTLPDVGLEDLDHAAWLERLQSQYVMREQHDLHDDVDEGQPSAHQGEPGAQGDRGMTFF